MKTVHTDTSIYPMRFILIALAFGIFGMIQGCKDDVTSGNDPDEEDIEVEAVISVNPEEPDAGEEVTLDGSGSTASEGDLEYSWTLTAPDGSDAELDDPEAETTTFTPDVSGDYEVELEVSAEGTDDTDQITITLGDGTQEISGTISEDITFDADILYRVVGDLVVENGATLTIEPGTVVEFESETSLQITSDAILSAIGTEEDSIKFTGTQQEAGWWNGLFINSTTHPDNELEYVVIEYGGGSANHTSTAAANLAIGRSLHDAAISVNNSTLRHSGGLGLFIHSGAEMPGSGNNTYTGNADGAAGVYTNTMHYLDDASDYTGNEEDYVLVEGNTLSDDATWQALNVPYAIYSDSEVEKAELTINAGAEFAFDAQTHLELGSGSITQANGTDEDPVLFRGLVKEDGWWNGIFVNSTTHPDNLLENVIIEHAGGQEVHSSTDPAGLTVGRSLHNASITLKNSTFRNSENFGVYVHSNGDIPNSENNEYSDNQKGPVSLSTDKMHYLDSGSTFSGNGEDYAWVRGNSLEEDVSWQPLDVPYGMQGESSVEEAELTIEPGAEFAFDAQASIIFNTESVIQAIGTEEDPIVFTGTEETAGWWNGILVRNTTHPNNAMEHVVIEYGGGDELHSSVDPANLVIGRSLYESYMSITNSTIRNSQGAGIFIKSNSSTNTGVCSENEFSGNGDSDCVKE